MKRAIRPLVPLLLVSIAMFAYGLLAIKRQVWPGGFYSRAFEAVQAERQRSREIEAVMANAALLHRRTLSTITTFMKTTVIDSAAAQPGLTLIAVGWDSAMLLDMQGRVVHRWHLPLSRVWRKPPHIASPNPDPMTRFIDVELFPNGDLLAVYHADNDTPYGYGMVKMDRDSNLLWALPLNAHHDLHVAHDGRIYGLTHRYTEDYARTVPHYKSPVLADAVVILSPDGRVEDHITLIEALRDTPYEQLLHVPVSASDDAKHDYTHANSVMRLEADIAPKFPLFRAGQLLVSLRNLDAIVVLDPGTRKVVWGARGPWKQQHDAQFTPQGRILIYDNLGYADGGSTPHSRILELDPADGAVTWYFTGAPATYFYSSFHGNLQRLPGGNMLLTESGEGNKVMEITPQGRVVWQWVLNPSDFRENPVNKAYRVPVDFLAPSFRDGLNLLPGAGLTPSGR